MSKAFGLDNAVSIHIPPSELNPIGSDSGMNSNACEVVVLMLSHRHCFDVLDSICLQSVCFYWLAFWGYHALDFCKSLDKGWLICVLKLHFVTVQRAEKRLKPLPKIR